MSWEVHIAALRLFSFGLLLMMVDVLPAQDVHVSQFFQLHTFNNPALTGHLERGDFRFSGLQRTQWRSVSQPFSSFHLSADAASPLEVKGLGTGIRIMNDRAGDSRFNTFALALSFAGQLELDAKGESVLRGGVEFGFTQKRIDDRDLRFDNQFNGDAYDPILGNGEPTAFMKVFHPDIHLGLLFANRTSTRRYWSIGLAAFNLTQPDVSFIGEQKIALDQRINAHAEYSLPVLKNWDIIPALQWMQQGPHEVFIAGARARVTWVEDAFQRRRGYIGAYARVDDGAYAYLGMDYDRWQLGMSYDVNLNRLEVASRNRGGLEISAIYILDIFKEELRIHRKCPDYL